MVRRWRKNSETCCGERQMPRTIPHSSMSTITSTMTASAATVIEVSMR